MTTELNEQEIQRRQNMQAMKEMGINPYPAAEYPTNAFSTDIVAEFSDEATELRQVCIAGRMMSRRIMGKASFIDCRIHKGLSRKLPPIIFDHREAIDALIDDLNGKR